MNLRHVFAAGVVLAAVGSATVVLQELRLQRNTQNIVASRIGGAWTLDATMTRRLSPEPRKDAPEKLMFTEDEGVLKTLQSAQSRFANKQIFSAGSVAINGGKPAPYVLTNENGNMSVVIYNGGEGSPTSTSMVYTMSLGYATNPRNDVLFLGNEAMAQSALAYIHEGSSPIAATATPASAPK